MSRFHPSPKQRTQIERSNAALLERKRIWVKPERLLVGVNRLGDPVFSGRIDSTVKCASKGCFRECRPKIEVTGVSKKPLGLVDLRITQETKDAELAAHKADLAQARAIRLQPEPAPKYGDAKVRIGTTPERTIMIMGDDGEMKFPKIKAKPKYAPVGLSSSVPNCQSKADKKRP